MAKLKLDLHDIFNKGKKIDAELERVIREACAKGISTVEIIPGKGSGQLKKKVIRFLDQKHIKALYHRVEKDSKNWGRLFVHFSMVFFFFCGSAGAAAVSLAPDEMARLERGDVVAREYPSGKKEPVYEAIGVINAPKEAVAAALCDYTAYPGFMPNVASVNVRGEKRGALLLDYSLKLPLGIRREYRLAMKKKVAKDGTITLDWHLVKRPDLSAYETIADSKGFWRLSDFNGDRNRTLAVHHVYTDPGYIPPGLGWLSDFIAKKDIPAVVVATKEYVERLKQ